MENATMNESLRLRFTAMVRIAFAIFDYIRYTGEKYPG